MMPPIPLSERLGDLRPVTAPALPSFQSLEHTICRIMDRFDAPPVPPEKDAEHLFAEMLRRISEHDWHKVPMSFVTRVATQVFAAAHRSREDLADIRRFLYREIAASDRQGFLNPMVRIYIETYEAGAQHTDELARGLSQARLHIGARWQHLLKNLPELLDPARAPGAIAAMMDGMESPWHGLREKGLRQPHAPGLMDAAHLEFVCRVAPRLHEGYEIDRLLSWLKPAGAEVRVTGAAEAVDALVRPWSNRQIPDKMRDLLCERLIEIFGDPRTGSNSVWMAVSSQTLLLLRRWLAKADMLFFIGVVDATQMSHMWPPRRDFWKLLYDQGRISEAWVAFSGPARRYAIRNLMRFGHGNDRRFGSQIAGGSRADTSLLIMRIGSRIVVDGCHSYKTHIFDADSASAPALYGERYDCEFIRLRSSSSRSHNPIDSWKTWVLQNI